MREGKDKEIFELKEGAHFGQPHSSQLTGDEAKCQVGSVAIDQGLRMLQDEKARNFSMMSCLILREGSRGRGDVPTKNLGGNAEQASVHALVVLISIWKQSFLFNSGAFG